MSQQTLTKRVQFPYGLKPAMLGVFVALSLLFSISALFVSPARASAATNGTINFQARLENASGNIAPDGNYFVQFNLYNSASGGTSLWTEQYQGSAFTCTAAGSSSTGATNNKIAVKDGYLTANLGSLCTFPSTINWDQDLWVTLNIGGSGATASWDGEMTPRLHLTSVPYAFRAGQLAQFNSGNGFTSTLNLVQPTSGNQAFQLPDMGVAGTYNLCIANSSACGFALSSGNTNYIQNQPTLTSAQTGTNFWIDGTGRAATALQAPLIDAATASTALNIGTTNASVINLNQNVVVASNKTLTVNGNALFSAATASQTAFQITSTSSTPLINIDSTTLNLVSNASFEPNIASWAAKGTATLSQTSSQSFSGFSSLQAIVSAASSGVQTSTFTSTPLASTQYEVTFMARCSASIATFTYGRQDVSGTDINSATTATCNTNWQRYTFHFTTGATITSPNIYMTEGTTASGTLWVDAVQMIQTTVSGALPFTPGSVKINGVINDPVVIRNVFNSTNAFEVQDTTGHSNTLIADTANNQVIVSALNIGASQVITSARVLQNVTANTSILSAGTLGIARGGTGVATTPTNGQLLIGNGAGYTLGTLTAGTGISITNAAGSITIASTGGGGTAGGDLTGTYPNPTIASLQGGTLTITTPTGGNFLQYNGTAWVNQSVSGDITISSAGVATIGAGAVTGTKIANNTITNTNLQSGAFGNITGTGSLAAGSIASGFGTISTGNNITTTATMQGGTINAVTALQTAGVTRIDASGNLTNIGNITSSGAGLRRTFNNVIAGTAGWFKLGTIALPQNGYNATIKLYAGSGYNADNTQNSWVELNIRTSNGTSVNAAGFAASGNAMRYGQNSNFASAIKLVSNAAGVSATAYDVYVNTSTFVGQGYYTVDASAGSNWTESMTTATDPGADSATVMNVPFEFIVQNMLYANGSGVGIGTAAPGTYRLNVQGGDVNFSGNVNIGATTVLTSGRVLQNVTADAAILTSGTISSARLSGSYSGITGVGTLNGLTLATNSTFTNGGSTLNTTVALTNFAASGAIGTAAATVDVATSFTINQTTASITLSVPNPTNAAAGRVVYIANIGTTNFTLTASSASVIVSPNTAAILLWNGSVWTSAGIDGSGANYIQNQNASTQTGNFKLSGTGTAATLQATTFDVAAAGILNIGNSLATTVKIADNAAAHTITFGNGAAVQGITIGSTNSTSSLLLQAGTGNLQIQTQGGTLGIGNNAVQQTLIFGNSTNGTGVTISAGTGGISIGNNAVANTIQIGSNSGTAIQTLNIGNTTNTGTAVSNVTIGTTVGASTTTIQAGSGDINFTTNNSGAGTFVKTLANTTQAFAIQNASSNPIFNADTTTGNTTISQGGLSVNGLANPTNVTLSTSSTGGSLAAATYYYRVSAVGTAGETKAILGTPVSVTTTGTTSSNTFSWSAVPYATGYKVYRTNNGGSTWFVNSLGSGTTSIVDNGSTYTWATSGTPNMSQNHTGDITLTNGSSLNFGQNGAQLFYDSTAPGTDLYAGPNSAYFQVQGDSFIFQDTTGYTNDFVITNSGATTLKNRVNSTAAFRIQNASGSTLLNMDTTTGNLTISGVIVSTVATGTAPLQVSSTTLVPNLNVQYLNGWSESQLAQNLRSGYNLSGGGTVGFDTSYNLSWSQRFIVIDNGNGNDFSTAGFFDINQPASGTVITGVGGASNVTAGAAGVPMNPWTSLYYILPIGSSNATVNANFRVASYTAGLQVPSNWVLIATTNGDTSVLKLGIGITLRGGQTTTNGTIDNVAFNTSANIGGAPSSPYTLDVEKNIHVCGTGTNCGGGQLFFGDNAYQFGSSASDANNPWIGEANGTDSDILMMSGSAGIQFQTSYTSDTFHYTSLYTETGHFCINNTTCTHQLGVNGSAAASSGFATGTPDIAEYITTTPDVTAYDVVAADPNNTEAVVKATGAMKNSMVGVISDGTSGFMMQNAHYGQAYDINTQGADANAKPMTLAGRIPVHVTNENGAIKPGDYLTVSNTMPGYAMKATQAGQTVGKALGFFDQSSGTVLALINLGYYNPFDGNHLQAQSGSFESLVASSAQFASLNVSGPTTLASLTVTGNASFQGDLTVAGTVTAATIVVSGHIITGGNMPVITVGNAAGQPDIVNGAVDTSTQPAATVSGTDSTGLVTVTTGANNLVSGALIHVQFAQNFTDDYNVVVSASNDVASDLRTYTVKTADGFDINVRSAASGKTVYQFSYMVLGARPQ